MILRLVLLLAVLVAKAGASDPPLILVSLDGFRWDYLEKYASEAPTLRQLKQEGVSARGLIPVFPSNTFPNHYTLVTGLYPAHHGIVNNDFFDAERGAVFKYNQPTIAQDPRWWRGEPIWVTAVKQGRKSAASFWVGSEAEIGGVRPTYWRPYNYQMPFEERLAELVKWTTLPESERPAVIVLYFEETNSAGHTFGPDSPQVAAAIRLLDTRLARMRDALKSAGVVPNLLVVSDHGMTATALDRVVLLDDYVDRTSVQVDTDGSVVAMRPLRGSVDELVDRLKKLPHAQIYRAAELPERFHLSVPNPRIAPVWILPQEGWHVDLRSSYERLKTRYAAQGYLQGDHGYDPALPSMRGLFIAHGPAFHAGKQLPEVENVHVYPLMCAVLKLRPAPNDGDDRLARDALRP